MALWNRLWRTWRSKQHSDDVRGKLRFQLDMDLADGRTPRDARLQFGNPLGVEEDVRVIGIVEWLDSWTRDLGFAVRYLTLRPIFAFVTIATLAIGIGSTTAIFAAVNAVLLRPLPYPDPERLFALGTLLTDGRYSSGRVAPIEVTRLNTVAEAVANAVVVQRSDSVVQANDGALQAVVYNVSRGFFDLVGLPMMAGSGFSSEDQAPTAPMKVVLSYHFWRDHFGSDKTVIGKPLRLGLVAPMIVGIAAPGVDLPPGADLWLNLHAGPESTARSYTAYLRARPDATRERLESEVQLVERGLEHENPTLARGRVFTLRPLVEFVIGDLGAVLIVVLSGAAMLLVLACVNVANLLLTQATARKREIALRAALGASRARIIRQLFSEAAVLAAAGGVGGFLVAWGGVRVLQAFGASHLPRLETLPIDSRVLLFGSSILIAVTMLVGLVPALRLGRLQPRLTESTRGATGTRRSTRALGALVVAEIALALTLVAGAGWVVRGYANLTSINMGFNPEGRLVFDALLSGMQFRTPAAVDEWFSRLSTRLHAVNGVTSVASASSFPLRPDWDEYYYIGLRGEVFDEAKPMSGRIRRVTPGYFSTLNVPLLAGRDFTSDDRQGGAPVTIVNRAFRDRYLGGRDPLSTQFAFGFPKPGQTLYTIVGVSENIRHVSPVEAAEPSFFIPQSQSLALRQTIVIATTFDHPGSLIPDVRRAVQEVDPAIAPNIEVFSDNVSRAFSRQRLGLTLMVLFALTALALAGIGIYGLIAYTSSLRMRDVATRIALGATPSQIFWSTVRQGTSLGVTGAVCGLLMSLAIGKLIAGRLYEVRVVDALVLLTAFGLVAAVVVVSIGVPARRVSRIESAAFLRPE